MAYIHKKIIGNTPYYTLRISYRKDGRVITKDLESLGSNLSKISIEDLEKRHKAEIKKSYKTIKKFLEKNYYYGQTKKLKKDAFLSSEQLRRVEACKLHFQEKFLQLDEKTQKSFFEQFLIRFANNSTAIEGNTITLAQATKLLREGILPKGKDIREVYDLQNTKQVFEELLFNENFSFSIDDVSFVHDSLLKNIDLRTGLRDHDISILGQPFTPSPARYVKEDLELLLSWLKKQHHLHPLVLTVLFHHKFEAIHPFSDGNGRTGRMLLNILLLQKEFPPLVVAQRRRSEYLRALNKADMAIKKDLFSIDKKHYEPLFSFMVDSFEETYWDVFLF